MHALTLLSDGATSSSLRGTHMHDATVHGKAAVKVLTATHDFDDPQALALALDPADGRAMDQASRHAATAFGLATGSLGGTIA